MRVITTALSELLASFVEGGSLALAVLAWAVGGAQPACALISSIPHPKRCCLQ
jgi:hypothetical protein